MARDYPRTRRVGEQIKRTISEIIRDKVKDPRVSMVTVTGVDIARDFKIATIYISVLGDADEIVSGLDALNHAAGFLRRELGHLMQLRHLPKLIFIHDTSIENGFYMDALIAKALSPKE